MKILQAILQFILGLFSKGKTNPTPIKPGASTPPKVTTPAPGPPVVETPAPRPPDIVEPLKNVLPPPIPLDANITSKTLRLGNYDAGVAREEVEAMLKRHHAHMGQAKPPSEKMRHGDLAEWEPIKAVEGKSVKALQTFLIHAGILPPFANTDGIFGYVTLAGVRLFQEYERAYGGKTSWIPDGIVGPQTWAAMQKWQQENKRAEKWLRGVPSAEYQKWMSLLERAKKHYQQHSHIVLDMVNAKVDELNAGRTESTRVDTYKVDEWRFDPQDIHLVGIRRKETIGGVKRRNDDVFVLLINGLVFKFWGSTDPNSKSGRRDEAFLVEGQHKFRFGWHNKSKTDKLYQGLNPYQRGVLVFRDDKATNDDMLTETDIKKGVDSSPNTTIHIHWTGMGIGPSGTWSAGCQVIAGQDYIDNNGTQQNCRAFAAVGTDDIRKNKDSSIQKTMGAYNVFCDLLLCMAPKPVDYIYYTLGRDDTLSEESLMDLGGAELLADTVTTFDLERGIA